MWNGFMAAALPPTHPSALTLQPTATVVFLCSFLQLHHLLSVSHSHIWHHSPHSPTWHLFFPRMLHSSILPWTMVTYYLKMPRQTRRSGARRPPFMDRPIKVPSWWGNWLHGFSCSHWASAHGETVFLKFFFKPFSYQTISSLFRWHYELQVTRN